jgi:hypothetical protein
LLQLVPAHGRHLALGDAKTSLGAVSDGPHLACPIVGLDGPVSG